MSQVIESCQDRVAFSKLLIAVARFTSESNPKPIAEVKREMKEALVMLCGTGNVPVGNRDDYEQQQQQEEMQRQLGNSETNGDPLSGMRSEDLKHLILYNLACVNYAEITVYLDRGSTSRTDGELHGD